MGKAFEEWWDDYCNKNNIDINNNELKNHCQSAWLAVLEATKIQRWENSSNGGFPIFDSCS